MSSQDLASASILSGRISPRTVEESSTHCDVWVIFVRSYTGAYWLYNAVVLGILCLITYVFYEAVVAPFPSFPQRLFRNKTFISKHNSHTFISLES